MFSTKLQKPCFKRSFACGAKFFKGAKKNSEKVFVLDFLRALVQLSLGSRSFSTKLQVLFDRRFLGGGFGGELLSKPLSASDEEQSLNSMSVAIQFSFKTDRKKENFRVKVCVCGENFENENFFSANFHFEIVSESGNVYDIDRDMCGFKRKRETFGVYVSDRNKKKTFSFKHAKISRKIIVNDMKVKLG